MSLVGSPGSSASVESELGTCFEAEEKLSPKEKFSPVFTGMGGSEAFEVEEGVDDGAEHPTSPSKKEEKKKTKKEKKKEKGGKKSPKKKDKKKGTGDQSPVTEEFVNPMSDEWPRDSEGNLVINHRRGREMCESVGELYEHLKMTSKKNTTVRDTYGLWLHIDDSDDDGDDGDEEADYDDGEIHFDRSFLKAQKATKDTKAALRVNNPDQMTPEELEAALKNKLLSTKGDRKAMADRLSKAFSAEATKMQNVSRVVLHFTSAASKRNLEFLVAKINSRSHETLQTKLQSAHADVQRLEKLYDVIAGLQGDLLERDARISSLNAKLGAVSGELGNLAGSVTGGGDGLGNHTIGAFAKGRSAKPGEAGGVEMAWTLDKIADTIALSSVCIILIIDTSSGFAWKRTFKSKKIKTKDGRPCRIIHTAWHLVNIASTSHFGGCAVADVLCGNGAERVIPDVVLVLDPCRSVHGEDHTHQLQALLHSGTPCINTAESMLACSDRPNVYAVLMGIRNRLGVDKTGEFVFPLIHQEFFANEAPGSILPRFPIVTKLSSVHSGFGKMRCRDNETYNELTGVIALSTDFYTTEDMLGDVIAEVYILQLGKTVRAYRKAKEVHFRTWSEWSADTQYEDIPMSSEYKAWAAQVQPLFGGLDIFAINVLEVEGGKEHIIGIHNVGCGLADQHANEDAGLIIDMVVKRVDARRKETNNYAKYS